MNRKMITGFRIYIYIINFIVHPGCPPSKRDPGSKLGDEPHASLFGISTSDGCHLTWGDHHKGKMDLGTNTSQPLLRSRGSDVAFILCKYPTQLPAM